MAKMHTGGHGKSKSRKPKLEGSANADNSAMQDAKTLILGYAKQNMHPAMMGQVLKEKNNVPYIRQMFGKRLVEMLEQEGFKRELPVDMLDLIKKAVNMREHIAANHNDAHNRLRLIRIESKIWRLTKYYKRRKTLPADWKYEPEKAALLVKG
jgi:small subunit ribosomal protein S15